VRVPVIREAEGEVETELIQFSGTLTSTKCPSSTQLIITVKTEKDTLVLSGQPQKISFGGKQLYCGMRKVRVQGYYLPKSKQLIGLKVQ
jgi:hypothetical protein